MKLRAIDIILDESTRFKLTLKTSFSNKAKERDIHIAKVHEEHYVALFEMIKTGFTYNYTTWIMNSGALKELRTIHKVHELHDNDGVYIISFNESNKLKRYIRKVSPNETLGFEYYKLNRTNHLNNTKIDNFNNLSKDDQNRLNMNKELYSSIRKDIIKMHEKSEITPCPVEGKMFFVVEALQHEMNHLRICDYELLAYSEMERFAMIKKFRFTEEINKYIKKEIEQYKGTNMRTIKAIHLMLKFAYNPELLKVFKKVDNFRR